VAVRLATGAWRRTRSKQDNFTYWIIQATQGLGLAVALGAPRWLPGLDIGGPTAATVAPALVLIAAGTILRVASGQANWLGLVAGIALPTAGYIWRMKSEEAVLLGALGEDYRNFAATRKRLVPGLY
ncbi:MAG TPA: hypothetical protein VHN36_12235, partial [Ilumatobacteraceae bacterium]|nr:hypothetical protein [Ilumatobacteraceae bacterium]